MSSQYMYYAAWVFLVIAILLAIFTLLCGCGSSCGGWGSSKSWRDAVTFFFALAVALSLLALYQYSMDLRFDTLVNAQGIRIRNA